MLDLVRVALSNPKFLPVVMIVLSSAAAVRYFVAVDFGRGVYWGAAAILNFSATFLMR